MKLIKIEKSVNEGKKRHYMPYKLVWRCSKCKNVQETDFQSDYFSYPITNKKFKRGLYCYDCENESDSVNFIIKEVLEIVEDE